MYKMIEVILACTKDGGIGYKNKLPWNIQSEMNIFHARTINSVVIVGRVTAENMPILESRILFIVGSNEAYFNSVEDAVTCAISNHPRKKIIVIGGKQIYDHVFLNMNHLISKIYLSVLKDDNYEIDTYLNQTPSEIQEKFNIIETMEFKSFHHYTLIPKLLSGEIQYLNLLNDVLENGKSEHGRNGVTLHKFHHSLEFDLTHGFPLLTTKKMFTRGIIEELLFFIRGDTDSKFLESKNVNIWKENTSRSFLDKMGFDEYPEGMMGPMYGYNWRFFGSEYDSHTGKPKSCGIDQFKNVINLIKTDPASRRIIMTDFNPAQAHQGVLYPCHSLILQFFVRDGLYLDMTCYNRSSDLFLGLPFNIASSSFLLEIVANLTGLKASKFYLTLGDCHIYNDHIQQVKTQLSRVPFKPPIVSISKLDIDNLTVDNFAVENYHSHGPIQAKMVP